MQVAVFAVNFKLSSGKTIEEAGHSTNAGNVCFADYQEPAQDIPNIVESIVEEQCFIPLVLDTTRILTTFRSSDRINVK